MAKYELSITFAYMVKLLYDIMMSNPSITN